MKTILIKYFTSLILILGVAGFIACSSGGDDEAQYSITFAENPVMVGSKEGSYTVQVTTVHEWKATTSDGWITGVTASGTGNGTLAFNVGQNSLNDFRDGTITLSVPNSSYTKPLTVRQMAYTPSITFNPGIASFQTVGGTQNIIIYANNNWVIDNVSGDWINAVRKNNSQLTVSTVANLTGAARSGEITVRDAVDNSTYTIPVTQEFVSSVFKGATTEMGRRFVHYSDGLVSGTVTSDKQYSINEQVSVLEIAYLDNAYNAYSVFIFDIHLKNGTTLRMTTADDEDSSIKTTTNEWTEMQIVRGQLAAMQNKRSATLDVLGGVNGDFCYIESTFPGYRNLLYGVMYRGGVCLKSTFDGGEACTTFALMKDGTVRIMTHAQYALVNKNDILEAIGGVPMLLSAGVNVSTDSTLEPRTAFGCNKEGDRAFLLIVDGRRSGYSVGASFPMMAKMFLAMGAYDATNTDGGGSATFAIKKSNATMPVTADSFETRNRPTDNTGDRAIPNGVAIVKLKN